MRGRHDPQATMLAFVDLEERVPQDHPIRTIKIIADDALARIHRRTPMDGVRTAAGWVRELQGRWLGTLG